MITNKDIKKLKKVFVTKDHLENSLKRQTYILVREIKTVINVCGKLSEKLDYTSKDHEIILDDHEKRIDSLENKAFV